MFPINTSKFRIAVQLLAFGLLLVSAFVLISFGTWFFEYQRELAKLEGFQQTQGTQLEAFSVEIQAVRQQIASAQNLPAKDKLQLQRDGLLLEKERLALAKDQIISTRDRLAITNTLYTMLIQAIQAAGSALVVVTVYISWKNFRREQDKFKREQAEQTSERFGEAIERLGDATLASRLAGIDFLKQIVEESPQKHWTVIEILAEHILKRSCAGAASLITKQPAPSDICEAVRAISQLQRYQDFENRRLNLTHAHLVDINLRGATLRKAELIAVNLCHSDLTNADLRETCMTRSNLIETTLFSAKFENAILNYVDFSRANAIKVDFRRTELHGAIFSDAVLAGADFTNADFEETNLKGADLRGAKGLTQLQIDRAFGDINTYLPDGLKLKDFR